MKRRMIIVFIFTMIFSTSQHSLWAQENKKEVMKPALLVIDIQNKFLPMMSQEDQDQAMEMINWAIWLFRQHELPVIRVYHTDPKWGPKPESEEFQFPESVTILDSDPKIVKNYGSAFKKTELDKVLKEKECNTLFLCGLSATGCVLATYHGGNDLDYHVFMIKDAMLSPKEKHTNFIEEISTTIELNTLSFMLDHMGK